jgi:hypothetical protein
MNELQLIWWTTIVLAAFALMVLFTLVVRRAYDEYSEIHERETRRLVQSILFKYMLSYDSGDNADLNNLLNFGRREKPVLRKLAIDLFHLVKGREREHLTAILARTGFHKECLKDLKRSNVRQRRLAAAALQIFDDKESREALIQALNDRDMEVRISAADSLLVIDALPDLAVLLEKLEPAIVIQSRDVRTLFRHIARINPGLLLGLSRHSNLTVVHKRLIAEAMSESRDYRVLQTLSEYAGDTDTELRSTAVRALAVLQHPGAAPVIKRGLADMSWQVRAVAAKAAGRIGLPECISQLNFLMDDRNWWVRFRAAEALFKIGDDGIKVLEVRAMYTGCGGFGRGARMAALVLDEHGLTPPPQLMEPANA